MVTRPCDVFTTRIAAQDQKEAHSCHCQTQIVRISVPPRRERKEYSVSIKRQLCRICDEHPERSQTQLVDLIEQQLGMSNPVSTLNRIKAGRQGWFTALHLECRRLRLGQHREMEDALLT